MSYENEISLLLEIFKTKKGSAMKRVLVFVTIFAILSVVGLSVAALDEDTPTGSTNITAYVTPSYTVTIPTSVTIPYNSSEAQEMNITASEMTLESGKKLVVSAKGSGTGDAFVMANGASTLAYELSMSSTTWQAVAAGGNVAEFSTNGTSVLYAKIPSWSGVIAGTYTGTITFTISVSD